MEVLPQEYLSCLLFALLKKIVLEEKVLPLAPLVMRVSITYWADIESDLGFLFIFPTIPPNKTNHVL